MLKFPCFYKKLDLEKLTADLVRETWDDDINEKNAESYIHI